MIRGAAPLSRVDLSFFHSPHPPHRIGTFAEGRRAVRDMLRILGPRLPAGLAVEILLKEPNEYFSIDTVADAIKWDVDLEKFRGPWPRRSGFLQACRNYLELKARVPIGDLTAGQITDPGNVADDGDDSGNAPDVQKENPLSRLEASLKREDDPELQQARTEFKAPNLMRMVHLGGGDMATQFIFDSGDTRGAVSCTIWSAYYSLNISQAWNLRLTKKSLEREYTNSRAKQVPYWYEFPPDTVLSTIAGDYP
jgi:hypothetical protein